jgi:hypothetical protein
MVSAVSFSGLGAFFESPVVSAGGADGAASLFAAGNFLAAALFDSVSGSCCAQAHVAKQQEVRIAADAKREVRSNMDWSFIVVCPPCGFGTNLQDVPRWRIPGSRNTILRGRNFAE